MTDAPGRHPGARGAPDAGPPRDRVRGAVSGFDGSGIRELAERTPRLATLPP
ncbi:hypothetical protein [Streptomyces sp. NPDC004435]|uniref:hypothetical protein n=1 Tax=Streptomyces sp. NPDC004435 TaxID=3364701 RepID=UPI0036B0FDA5